MLCRIMLCIGFSSTILGCTVVPQSLSDSTQRAQETLVKDAQATLDRFQASLATLDTHVAAVASQATGTLQSTQKVADTANTLLLVALAGVSGTGGAVGVQRYLKKRKIP